MLWSNIFLHILQKATRTKHPNNWCRTCVINSDLLDKCEGIANIKIHPDKITGFAQSFAPIITYDLYCCSFIIAASFTKTNIRRTDLQRNATISKTRKIYEIIFVFK